MSFSINTNLDALNSLFKLNSTGASLSKAMERLSSGLRINSPADDPAGSVIANSLQSQIDGLTQAAANVQDASNLVKTATGAMGQINGLLSTIKQNALYAANTGVADPTAVQANQQAITAAIQAINNIASSTKFGSRSLLDGSAGIAASVTNSSLVGGLQFGGTFGGGVTQAGSVTITVNNAATLASATGAATYASVNSSISTVSGGTSGTGGTVTINGQSLTVTGSDTVQTLINKINNLSGSTGVTAAFSNGSIGLTQSNYGANYKINLSESASLIVGAGSTSTSGANATVTVTATILSNGSTTTTNATFVGGRSSTDSGLRVTDTNGNSILLTAAGNNTSTSSQAVGTVSANALQFQIGSSVGQTASVSINGVFASSLGATSVSGQTLATIDVTSQTGANNALTIVSEAQTQVAKYQAQLGAFQNSTLQSSQNYLGVAISNISASVSSIQDANIAEEVMNMTKYQILQQSGISALSTANQTPGVYLRLITGLR